MPEARSLTSATCVFFVNLNYLDFEKQTLADVQVI